MEKLNLEKIKSSINSLNPKEIHNWPLWANLMVGTLVFVGVLGGGVMFKWMAQVEALDSLRKSEQTLKNTFVEKKRLAINLEEYKNQLKEITIASDALLKQLPNRSEMDKLLLDINQAAVSRGLQIELFKPSNEKLTEFYAELPIAIKVIGSYENLGNFAADVSNLSRVVLFDEIKIYRETKNQNSNSISMEVRAKTFRYLDQEELDKQKAAKAAAKAAEKKKRKK